MANNPIADTVQNYASTGGWWGALFAGVMLSLFINVAAWFFASFTADDRLKGWVKRELVQLGYTVLIGVFAIMLVTGPFLPMALYTLAQTGDQAWANYVAARCMVPSGQLKAQLPCHIALAADYLDILFKGSQNIAQSVLSAYSFLAVLQSLSLEVKGLADPAGILNVAPLIGLSIPLETMSIVIDFAVKNMMVIRAQQFFLEFFHFAFFPLFLSLGLIFRSMFFTRRWGGLFIALALSFYIVYPMCYVFFEGVLFSLTGPWTGGGLPQVGGTNLDTLYMMQMNWTNIAKIEFSSPQQFYEIKNGAALIDETGAKRIDEVSSVRNLSLYEKSFVGTNRTGTKEYTAKLEGGKLNIYGMPYSQGMTGVMPTRNADYRLPEGSVVSSEFREKYGDPYDPKFNTNPDQVRNLAPQIVAGVCADTASPESVEAEKNTVKVVQDSWSDRLFQGYIRGIYYILDPANDTFLGFNGPLDNLAKILVFSLIAPFVAIMVSLSAVKVLSPLLGGDVEIAGLTRII